ncbi:MAG: THUMP domain-containing protein [Bacteriovoracaceae bacterium]
MNLFVQVTPGLEEILVLELERYFSTELKDLVMTHGGVDVLAPLHLIEKIHLWCKTPNRVLLRIESFKARDFPKLYKKTKNLNWKNYLLNEQTEVQASTKNSRLIHTDRIKSSITKAIKDFFKGNPTKKSLMELKISKSAPTIFIRIVDDEVQVSLDLSGDPLYKRGLKRSPGKAPLRENYAAAIYIKAISLVESDEVCIIDPMAGAGSFLLEAKTIDQNSKREFSFEQLPVFLSREKNHLSNPCSFKPARKAIGIEKNSQQYLGLKNNLNPNNDSDIILLNQLFQSCQLQTDSKNTKIICTNPPYGKKIGVQNLQTLIDELFQFSKEQNVEVLSIMLPSTFWNQYNHEKHKSYQYIDQLKFGHGGIQVSNKFFKMKNEVLS